MKLMSYKAAVACAVEAGATVAEVEAEALKWARHKGSVPLNNMVVALHLAPWRNGKAEWVRLAAALKVRNSKR